MIVSRRRLGALIAYVGRPLALLFALDVAIVAAYMLGKWTWLSLPDVPLSIFGGVIGLIAGFRNSSAYARWWEARTIWGSVVNQSRTFARQVLTTIEAPDPPAARPLQRALVRLQIAWVHALRNRLRHPESARVIARPLAIQQRMACLLALGRRRGWIDDVRWVNLDRTLTALTDCHGASERIKNTPMPLLYDMFIRTFVDLYCLVLPLGMVASLGILTPFGSTLVGFIFLALDKIGRDLENPFDNLPHDIPLSAISRTIEIDLKRMIGENELPQPLAPVDGILW
jgi:putative membrane protein